MGAIQKLCWAVTFLAAAFAVYLLVEMLKSAGKGEPAMAQISLAVAASAIALVPYILSRALQELLRPAAGATTQSAVLALAGAGTAALWLHLGRQPSADLASAPGSAPSVQAEPAAPTDSASAAASTSMGLCRTMGMIGMDIIVYCAVPWTTRPTASRAWRSAAARTASSTSGVTARSCLTATR